MQEYAKEYGAAFHICTDHSAEVHRFLNGKDAGTGETFTEKDVNALAEEKENTLLFLGSGAADWKTPQPDGEYRRNAAALLNGTLLFDCGPKVWEFDADWPLTLQDVTDVLLTHDHDDHFHLPSLLRLAERRPIRLACDGFVRSQLAGHENIRFVHVQPFVPFRLGRYAVIPVPANHDVVMQDDRLALHYIVRTPNGKTLFYGLDGAWFLRPSWQQMQRHKFDVMVLDCTVGDREDWRLFEHNTVPMLRMMTRQIEQQQMLAKGGCIVASHFSRLLHGTHAETAHTLEQFHVRAAFDGMRIFF